MSLENLSCKPRKCLTSILTIVFELDLDGIGQPKQEQGARADYRLRSLLALRNKTQNTTVMKTSPAAVRGVNRGNSIDLSGIGSPPSAFTVNESA